MESRHLLAIVMAGVVAAATLSGQTPGVALPIAADARAVALVPAGTLSDRNGQVVAVPVAVVASGDHATGGRLRIFDVGDPSAPVLIGSAQLTAISGQPSPPGVPDLAGTPRHVVVGSDGRAFVAIENVGLVTVRLGQLIPDDPANPGAAIGPRYPASGSADIAQAAVLGNRVVAAGATAFAVLDAGTLTEIGSAASSARLTTVAGLAAFRFDANGDGRIDAASEVIDLAIAGDDTGVLQFYRVPAEGAPVLISAVRMPPLSLIGGVRMSADEMLAYVGLGGPGLALVDLNGPSSIQPIDLDRDGLDDRVLGIVDTPGLAGRLGLDLARGAVRVAESTGLPTVQVIPPRVRFLSLQRDPIRGRTGDEETLVDATPAYVTDEAIVVDLQAFVPAKQSVAVAIEEVSSIPGRRLLSFDSGATVITAVPGGNHVFVRIPRDAVPLEGALVARDASGALLARRAFRIVEAPANPDIRSLFVEPPIVELSDAQDRAPLSVGGTLADGRVLNVTLASTQTRYRSMNAVVAQAGPDGEVVAGAGGRTGVEVSNGRLTAGVGVRVNRAPILTALYALSPLFTLITTDSQSPGFTARFSDDSERPATEVQGTVFTTSDPGIVAVDSQGRATAVSDGAATIRAVNDSIEAEVRVHVELRGSTSVTALDLAPLPSGVTADQRQVIVNSTLAGSGGLHGLTVTFTSSAGATARGVTDASGLASASLGGFSVSGPVTVTASVVDPATGTSRTDSESMVVGSGTSDTEPNDSDGSASPLGAGRTASGTLGGGDTRDTFRVAASVAGTLRLNLRLTGGTSPADIVIVVRDAQGLELFRTTPAVLEGELLVDIPSAGAFVSLELTGSSAQYVVDAKLMQGPVTIATVTPPGGAAGTTVVITGSGFSTQPSENGVFFAGVRAKLLAASINRLEVMVPALARDGELRVVAGGRGTTGPNFIVGDNSPLPTSFTLPASAAKRRYDPLSGAVVDVSRVWVDVDATVTRATVEQRVNAIGGTLAGFLPLMNRYLVERVSNDTLAGLRSFQAAVEALPDVLAAFPVASTETTEERLIDMRNRSDKWFNGAARADTLKLINLFEAIDAVRRTDPFGNPFNLRKVRVAVIDTGFQPTIPAEFPGTVKVLVKPTLGDWFEFTPGDTRSGHGTLVTGVIAAANDGTSTSGVLASMLRSEELLFSTVTIEVLVYSCGIPAGGLGSECIEEALHDIQRRRDIDVVNMSFMRKDFNPGRAQPGCPEAGTVYVGAWTRCDFYKLFQPVLDRTLFVAGGGNDGIQSEFVYPASLESDLDNVVSVGAVAVSNVDGTGEGADARARFGLLIREPVHPSEVNCGPLPATLMPASNCGPGITFAAPGEDLWTTRTSADGLNVDYDIAQGTSLAAPVVTGVAALLQAIRPSAQTLEPAALRTILEETADDISATWQSISNEPMKRINALGAVRRVLPAITQQRIFVADQKDGAPSGTIVALNVDPLSGVVSGAAVEIPLEFTAGSATVKGTVPRSIVTASPGDWAFVLASTDLPGGDGVFVLNTTSLTVENFIPLNGDSFPAASGSFALPVRTSLKSSMAVTRTGRVLFVSAGSRIVVIDTLTARVVRNLTELSWPLAVSQPVESVFLPLRATDFQQAVQGDGGEITGLTLSPDDRTLYAVVQTGVGSDLQPGFLMELDVALDLDRSPTTAALEPDLGNFFRPKGDPTRLEGHDEPSVVAAAPNGKHVYLTNGGVQSFGAVLPGITLGIQIRAFIGSLFGDTTGGAQLIRELESRAYTQLLAAGTVQAFDVQAGALNTEVWRFPSELSVGWTPSTPVVSDQFVRRRVNSERTFGMTFRPPDGRRALVTFFQTGNFGVLDMDGQAAQPQSPAPAAVLQGLVAVTPSLNLDEFLSPPAEQQPFQYPTRIVYAQNGRFAVAVHTGVHGGAVTILDDELISTDLASHLGFPVPNPDTEGSGNVPFYAVRPLCAERATADASDCTADVFTRLREYATASGSTPFTRPRDVAIQPFVNVVSPGFGDRASRATPIHLTWRDGRASSYRISVFDLGVVGFGNPTDGTLVGSPTSAALTTVQRNTQSLVRSFGELFTIAAPPQDNHRYRVEAQIETASGQLLATQIVEVVFRQ